MKKIVTVIGARPQFVKAATVSRAIINHNNESPEKAISEIIVHTGQHYDPNMSDVFFDEMEIPRPQYSLGVGGGSHGAMTGRQLEKVEEVLLKEKPDGVLVYGDTNSTLAGALAAAKLHIPVFHVEAGLRSFNMEMPEEINRILTDQISTLLFCPTETAINNLKQEGFDKRPIKMTNTGDVMYDAALYYSDKSFKPSDLKNGDDQFALVTVHRAENTDNFECLAEIVNALNELAKDMKVVCPLHPRTKKIIENSGFKLDIAILEPVSYFEMIWLLQHCEIVLTDSGGLQKEAYFFKKPCVTLREETEWVELVEMKANILAGSNKKKIHDAVKHFKNNSFVSEQAIYGDGQASKKIVQEIVSYNLN